MMTLRFKLLFPLFLLLTVAFMYSNYFVIPSYVQLIESSKIEEEESYIDLLSRAILPDLLESDLANMYDTLNKVLSQRKHWYSLYLYNPEGIRIYPLEERYLPKNIPLDPLQKEVVFNGTNYATVRLMLDIDATTNQKINFIQNIKYYVLLMLIFTFLFTLLLLENFVSKPLNYLTNLANKITKGNYSARVKTVSRDEVGLLGNALETMRQSLNERAQAIDYYTRIQDTIRLVQSKFISEHEQRHVVFLELQRHILLLTGCEDGFIGELLHDDNDQPYLQPYFLNKVLRISSEKAMVFNHGHTPEALSDMNSLLGKIITKGQPVIDNGPVVKPEQLGFPVSPTLECKNFIALPLYSGYKFVGVLCLVNRQNGFDLSMYNELDVLLQALAQLIVAYRERQNLVGSETRLRTVIEHSVEGIISTNEHGIITEFNSAAERIFGYSQEQIKRSHVNTLVPSGLIDEYTRKFTLQFMHTQARQIHIESEATGLHRNSQEIPLEISISRVITSEGIQFTGIVRDITERKRNAEKLNQAYADLQEAHELLEEQNRRDALTGLANRRFMEEKLRHEWQQLHKPGRNDAYLTIMLCDIDHFKLYNDTYGHPQGDLCLKQVAGSIAKTFARDNDLVVRYGGEEFMIICPNTSPESAQKLAEQMLQHIRAMRLAHEQSDSAEYVTISVGITVVHASQINDIDLEQTIQRADAALYEAKQLGRNQAVYLPTIINA